MLLKACPKCKVLIPQGIPYCSVCSPIAEAEREAKRERMRKRYNRTYNSKRDPKYMTFYRSKEWRATSRAKLTDAQYKCEAQLDGCTKLAVEVHHIKPIQTEEGWSLRLEWSNLEALCTACHNGRHPGRHKRKAEPGVIDLREIDVKK